jgi:hypothetical protein
MGPPLQHIDPVDMQPMQLNSSVSVAVTATFIQAASVAGTANCKTAAEWTNADELRLGVLALEHSRPDFWVRPTHTRDCGLREEASTLYGLCVENHPELLGLACLTTASPSRASQLVRLVCESTSQACCDCNAPCKALTHCRRYI